MMYLYARGHTKCDRTGLGDASQSNQIKEVDQTAVSRILRQCPRNFEDKDSPPHTPIDLVAGF